MINVTRPYFPDLEKYKQYLEKIYDNGWLTNNGELVQHLQKRLEEYLGVKNLLLVANGTMALMIAYRLLALQKDVVTTPFSFVATSSSLVWEGLSPVFADINLDSFNIDENLIENAIGENTSAIVATHVFGNPCALDKIQEIADKHSLKLVYDAAHSFGVKFKGESILKQGDVSILSFHATKLFHTAEGGALVINDNDLYEQARRMINFGFVKEDTVTQLGINAKMNELQAAMGLCVLDDIDEIIEEQCRIIDEYSTELEGYVGFQESLSEVSGNCTYFPIVLESESETLELKAQLMRNDVRARRYFYPSLNKMPFIKERVSCPNSESLSSRILSLPVYPGLAQSDQDMVIAQIKRFFK
jgi:dTDP-4-amino-4,6-dideoxygalactose transaminase